MSATRDPPERAQAGLMQGKLKELALLLNGITDGIGILNQKCELVYANEAGAKMCGFSSAAELLAAPTANLLEGFELMDEEGRPLSSEELPWKAVMAKAQSVPETIVRLRSKKTREERWSILTAAPILDDAGAARFAVIILKDFTERKRAEELLKVLDEAGRVLASSLDYSVALTKIAELAVPRLADWCVVSMVEKGALRSLAVAHADPGKVQLARELEKKYPPDLRGKTGVPRVIRTGESSFVPEVTEEMLKRGAIDPEHFERLRALEIRSVMIVPLSARGACLGAITFISTEARRYTKQELLVAEALGRRGGMAVENARLYQRLREDNQKLREEREISERFVATLTHDLRSPLSAAKMGAEILMRHGAPPELTRRIAPTIASSIERADRMIQDLLDANLIRAGQRPPLTLALCNLGEIAFQAVAELSLAHGQRFVIRKLSAIDGFWSQLGLRRIIDNLAINALKYGDPAARVTLDIVKSGEEAIIRVHNFGPGLTPDEMATIFQPFRRTLPARRGEQKGWGLGLTLVRGLARAHGGSVSVHSDPKSGTTFEVRLPLDARPYQSDNLDEAAPRPN